MKLKWLPKYLILHVVAANVNGEYPAQRSRGAGYNYPPQPVSAFYRDDEYPTAAREYGQPGLGYSDFNAEYANPDARQLEQTSAEDQDPSRYQQWNLSPDPAIYQRYPDPFLPLPAPPAPPPPPPPIPNRSKNQITVSIHRNSVPTKPSVVPSRVSFPIRNLKEPEQGFNHDSRRPRISAEENPKRFERVYITEEDEFHGQPGLFGVITDSEGKQLQRVYITEEEDEHSTHKENSSGLGIYKPRKAERIYITEEEPNEFLQDSRGLDIFTEQNSKRKRLNKKSPGPNSKRLDESIRSYPKWTKNTYSSRDNANIQPQFDMVHKAYVVLDPKQQKSVLYEFSEPYYRGSRA